MNKENNVMAGIVTYNPSLDRLILNIDAILRQVKKVIVVDNFSENHFEIKTIIKKKYKKDVEYIQNNLNLGIGNALNKIFQVADSENFEWVVTLDQDSIVPSQLVESYFKYKDLENVGQIASNIYEKNSGKFIYGTKTEFSEVGRCITSGTMTKVIAWKISNGYDEKLFIDYVDYDFSMKVLKHGFKIIRCNKIYLEHELGESEKRYFIFIPVRIPNYSPFRKYFIARNIIIYIKRYFSIKILLLESMRLFRVIIYTFYEKNRKKKLITLFSGVLDGIKYK